MPLAILIKFWHFSLMLKIVFGRKVPFSVPCFSVIIEAMVDGPTL